MIPHTVPASSQPEAVSISRLRLAFRAADDDAPPSPADRFADVAPMKDMPAAAAPAPESYDILANRRRRRARLEARR